MSLEQNKAIARRHFEELWTKGDLAVADEIYSIQAVGHYGANPPHTGYPEFEKEVVRQDRVAFPDGVATVQAQIAEGDRVVTRWRFEATHTGPLYDNPPSGRALSVSGVHIHRIVDGQIVEIWAHPDTLTFMTQLGLVPAPTVEVV
jgi:predicted ester cyclase